MYSKEKLLELLSSKKTSIRYDACEWIRVSQESSLEIVTALEKATHDEDKEVAERAAYALQADIHHQMAIEKGIIKPDVIIETGIAHGGGAFIARALQRERIGRLLRMYADRREDITEVLAGDIGAVLGLKNSFTGDTLCDASNVVVLENITFPEPVISVAIEPKTTADQDKMGEALRKLSEEDPTFRVRGDEDTGQTIIEGMGELHLEVLVDRMLREFRVQARVGRPQVSYRESITAPVERAECRYVKQSGGRGQYGHVVLELQPGEPGSGISRRLGRWDVHRRRHKQGPLQQRPASE